MRCVDRAAGNEAAGSAHEVSSLGDRRWHGPRQDLDDDQGAASAWAWHCRFASGSRCVIAGIGGGGAAIAGASDLRMVARFSFR